MKPPLFESSVKWKWDFFSCKAGLRVERDNAHTMWEIESINK
jgi:hypothetical protein